MVWCCIGALYGITRGSLSVIWRRTRKKTTRGRAYVTTMCQCQSTCRKSKFMSAITHSTLMSAITSTLLLLYCDGHPIKLRFSVCCGLFFQLCLEHPHTLYRFVAHAISIAAQFPRPESRCERIGSEIASLKYGKGMNHVPQTPIIQIIPF